MFSQALFLINIFLTTGRTIWSEIHPIGSLHIVQKLSYKYNFIQLFCIQILTFRHPNFELYTCVNRHILCKVQKYRNIYKPNTYHKTRIWFVWIYLRNNHEIKLHIEEKLGGILLSFMWICLKKTHEIKLHIECNQVSHIYPIMQRLFMFSKTLFLCQKEVACITWIFLSFLHRLLVSS